MNKTQNAHFYSDAPTRRHGVRPALVKKPKVAGQRLFADMNFVPSEARYSADGSAELRRAPT